MMTKKAIRPSIKASSNDRRTSENSTIMYITESTLRMKENENVEIKTLLRYTVKNIENLLFQYRYSTITTTRWFDMYLEAKYAQIRSAHRAIGERYRVNRLHAIRHSFYILGTVFEFDKKTHSFAWSNDSFSVRYIRSSVRS